jgi:hypothetical protein
MQLQRHAQNTADLLVALSGAPARSALANDLELGGSHTHLLLVLDFLVVCFLALSFAAVYSRTREWVQKVERERLYMSKSSAMANMAIKKAEAVFHIAFYALIGIAGILCIWTDADMFNMYARTSAHISYNILYRIRIN